MKRSNREKGQKPTTTCASCGAVLPSKYAAKKHICRFEEEAVRYG